VNRFWVLAAVIAFAAHAEAPAKPLISPACLSQTLDRKASLATIHSGKVSLQRDVAPAITVETGTYTVCVDDPSDSGPRRVVALGHGLALVLYAPPASLTKAESSAASWKSLRAKLKEDAQQVGCLKMLPVGMELFARPGGEKVGEVIEATPYGKWDSAEDSGVHWSQLKVNVGFGMIKVWIKDDGRDWCPE
jgi:hypothetical protein